MPIIEGADLSNVSSAFDARPEGEYTIQVKESKFEKEGKFLVIHSKILSGPDGYEVKDNDTYQDWINLKQNDGKVNEIGYKTIKRYLEWAFGKGSPEANQNDTDVLNGYEGKIYLTVKNDNNGDPRNQIKRFITG